jgi:hypothetical protein
LGSDPANCLIYQIDVGIKGVVWPQRKPFQSFNRFASFKSFKPFRRFAPFNALRRFKVQGSMSLG